MRYDLAFFLCCCNAFLATNNNDNDDDDNDNNSETNYYGLLGVSRDATVEEIKKAYKTKSLQLHPDKLAQRGQTVTPERQAAFLHLKTAYEVLNDPHKRETYDAIGARGMQWLEEPFSIDPAEIAHNFAQSSVWDRSKIFGIFVGAAVLVLIQPVLVCLHIDGAFGSDEGALWLATLTPLWLWDAFLLFYHSRVILLGPIPKPDHIPEADWVDPLPMPKRIFSMARFVLIVIFEILAALKLDSFLTIPWTVVFIPLYIWEATTLYKKWPLARMRIVTVEDLEAALGKPFSEFTSTEKELIGQRYSVVSSTSSPDFDVAQKLKRRARHDIGKSCFRIAFCVILLLQLDGNGNSNGDGNNNEYWNWWLVFLPFWIMTALMCYANYQAFAEVQKMAAEKDPTLFMPPSTTDTNNNSTTNANSKTDYGAVGENGAATPSDTQQTQTASPLSPEEREELKAQVMASTSKLCSKCCSQAFLLVMLCLVVAKLQGAGFSSFLIISPFLATAGILLCCIGCAIFGVTEVPTDGIGDDFAYVNAEAGGQPATPTTTMPPAPSSSSNPNVYVPPPPPPPPTTSSQQQQQNSAAPVPAAAAAVVVPPPPSSSTVIPGSAENSAVASPTPGVAVEQSQSQQQPSTATVDLLDTQNTTTNTSVPVVGQGQKGDENNISNNDNDDGSTVPSEIHELD